MPHHLKRTGCWLLFWLLLTSALLLTAMRLVLANIGQFKPELAAHATTLIGVPVHIGRLGARWRGLTPTVVVQDLHIGGQAVRLQELRLRLDLPRLLPRLLVGQDLLSAASATVVGAQLALQRRPDGRIGVLGLADGGGWPAWFWPTWLSQLGHYRLLQTQLSWQDLTRPHPRPVHGLVDVAVRNSGHRHSINALINLPGDGQAKLALRLTGDLASPAQIDGQFFAQATHLPYATASAILPLPPRHPASLLSASGQGRIRAGRLDAAHGEIKLRADHAAFQSLAGRWRWLGPEHDHGRWRLDIPSLQLALPGRAHSPDNQFSLAGDGHTLAWAVRRLDLTDATLLHHWLPARWQALPDGLSLSGQLEHMTGIAGLDHNTWAVSGAFGQLRVNAAGDRPFSAGPFAGRLRGDQRTGHLRVSGHNGQLEYPAWFRQPLKAERFQATVAWRQQADAWLLASPAFSLELAGVKALGKLRWSQPKDGRQAPFLDGQLALTAADASQLPKLLPAGLMRPADVRWLDAAFVKGRVRDGRVLYHGRLGQAAAPPVFQAVADVEGVELNYDPQWPHVLDVAARVSFSQNAMVCEIHRGHSGGLAISKAQVVNPALGASPMLAVNGQLHGALADVLAFIRQTPLNNDLGGLADAVQAQGQTTIHLNLDLALSSRGRTRLAGQATLNQARLRVKAADLWLESINGELSFTEAGLYSDAISASALGRPVSLRIDHHSAATTVSARGEATVAALANQFPLPVWAHADGLLAYQALLKLPTDGRPPQLDLSSDLADLRLELPQPLAKEPGQPRPSSVSLSFPGGPLLPVSIRYGRQLRADLRVDRRDQRPHSGHVLIGEGEPPPRGRPGLKLEIRQPQLDLAAWAGLAAGRPGQAAAAPAFTELAISTAAARWQGQALGFFNLSLHQRGNHWRGDLDSAIAQGQVQIPVNLDAAGTLSLDLRQLDLSLLPSAPPPPAQRAAQRTNSPPSAGPPPQHLPLLALTSQRTLWRGVDLGRLTVSSQRIDQGLAVHRAKLVGDGQQWVFSGAWTYRGGQPLTQLEGELTAARVGQWLSGLGITDEFRETDGRLQFALRWPAPPHRLSVAGVSGTVALRLANGRILSIEPGLGRLLGLVAMAQWDRRLRLDFRDIFGDGLSFDSIEGRFRLSRGVAHVEQLLIDAVAAKITISGHTDLNTQRLDHIVQVAPKGADAVPIAGRIVDTLLSLANRAVAGDDAPSAEVFLLGSEYRVRGSWSDMDIAPTGRGQGLLQKTWEALADFPWPAPGQQPPRTPPRTPTKDLP